MDLRHEWFESLMQSHGTRLGAAISVTGECRRHIGPAMQIASVTLRVSPADKFELKNEVTLTKELVELQFPEFAIFGFLDVIMTADSLDTTQIRIAVESAVIDSIGTSAFAFREAGRDAARKLLQTLKLPTSTVSRQTN